MNLPLNALAMFVAMCACFVFAYFVWTASTAYFIWPTLIKDAIAYLCVGLGFVFLALFVAAVYDDLIAQETSE